MSTAGSEKKKATFRRFCEGLNTADVELIATTIDEFVEPDALVRTPLPIGLTSARALKEVFTRLHQAYPDLHIMIEDVIEEGDKVVISDSVTGTRRGEYMGIPPTGRNVQRDLLSPGFLAGRGDLGRR
jgi:predicted ester cyclase